MLGLCMAPGPTKDGYGMLSPLLFQHEAAYPLAHKGIHLHQLHRLQPVGPN